jgi:hypothetical protein
MENTNKVLAQTQIPIKKTKTIVICWQQYCYNMHQDRCSNFWGIGDIIRGTVACYQICKRYNNSEREVNIIVDTHKHPVGKLLKNNTSIFSDKLDKMGDYVPFIKYEDIIIYLERALINSDNDTVFFMTNANAGLPLKNDEKEFMKKLLEPGEHLSRLIDKHRSYLPKEYSVQHYRLGDNELVRNETYNNIYWGLYTKLVQNYLITFNSICFTSNKFLYCYNFNRENIFVSENLLAITFWSNCPLGNDSKLASDLASVESHFNRFSISLPSLKRHSERNSFPSKFWGGEISSEIKSGHSTLSLF